MPQKKKKEYLPLFRLLGGKNKAYDIGEGEQEGYLQVPLGDEDEEEEEDTGWRGNLSGSVLLRSISSPELKANSIR